MFDDEAEFDDFEDEFCEDEDIELERCPECGAEYHALAECCPQCGHFPVEEPTSVWSHRPWWWIALGALGVIAVIWVLLGM